MPSGRYKTHKVDLTGWNSQENALVWRKAWADISNDYLERAGSPERIDHRSNAERGIDEIPTVHMGVAACQMEKKKPEHFAVRQYKKYKLAAGVVCSKRLLNQMIWKSLRTHNFTYRRKETKP